MSAERDEVVICSFDVGEKNFAFAKSRVKLSELEALRGENVPFNQRYDANGECTPKFAKLLRTVSLLGSRVAVGKCDLTHPTDKKFRKRRVITNRILARLTNYLEDLNQAGVYDDVNYFVIEEQRSVASNNQQLENHLRGYLVGLFLTFRPIVILPSKYKTQILGAPKKLWNERKGKPAKMTYAQRKKFSRDRAFQILTDRGDETGVEEIFIKKKYGPAADVSDCLIQIEAFLYLVFIDCRRDILDC